MGEQGERRELTNVQKVITVVNCEKVDSVGTFLSQTL